MYRALFRFAALLAVLGLVLWGVRSFFYWDNMRIQNLVVSDEHIEETDRTRYEQSLAIAYDEPRVLVPQDSIFRNHRRIISENLYGHFPAIKLVNISRADPQTVQVVVFKRDLSYHYRHGDGTLYRLDQMGMLYEQETGGQEVVRVYEHDTREDSLDIGDTVLHGDYGQVNTLLDDLDILGITVKRIVMVNEIEMVLHVDNGVALVIDPSVGYEAVSETLREILPYKEFAYNFSEGRFDMDVDYINLRYGNRILYCYQGDECAGYYR